MSNDSLHVHFYRGTRCIRLELGSTAPPLSVQFREQNMILPVFMLKRWQSFCDSITRLRKAEFLTNVDSSLARRRLVNLISEEIEVLDG